MVFDLALTADNPAQTITWQTTVSNLQPGEARNVTLASSIEFTSQGASGMASLPPVVVAAEQILALDPATQTVRPGEAASYNLTLANPTATAVTSTLSVQGVPAAEVGLVSSVTVGAQGMTSVPFTLTTGAFEPPGDLGFTITAAASNGASGSVGGELVLAGEPLVPVADPVGVHGLVATLTPTQATAGLGTAARYVVRLTNTGSANESYTLTVSGLPANVSAAFGETTVDLPPGASNFLDVPVILTTAPNSARGAFSFTVKAASTSSTASASTAGTLNVVANGVSASLSPSTGRPGSPLQLKVTNTGNVSDTFNVALGGPAALVATLGSTAVTLAPGQASQVVSITTATRSTSRGPGRAEPDRHGHLTHQPRRSGRGYFQSLHPLHRRLHGAPQPGRANACLARCIDGAPYGQ